jgi:hypothetical protein
MKRHESRSAGRDSSLCYPQYSERKVEKMYTWLHNFRSFITRNIRLKKKILPSIKYTLFMSTSSARNSLRFDEYRVTRK